MLIAQGKKESSTSSAALAKDLLNKRQSLQKVIIKQTWNHIIPYDQIHTCSEIFFIIFILQTQLGSRDLLMISLENFRASTSQARVTNIAEQNNLSTTYSL